MAFIRARQIMDNIVVVEELIFNLQKKGVTCNIIKVNFTKAFNLVDCEFLL